MSYIPLTVDDQVVSNDIVVSTAWSGDQYTLTKFFINSTQESSQTGKFYLDVYQTQSSAPGAAVQFQIAWGDNNGSGSAYFSSVAPTYTPSKDIYRQYRALILGDENSKFNFSYVSGSDQIAVISVERARYKQAFNPGSLTLMLANSSGDVLSLTDNSQIQTNATFINNTQYYTLVSGSQGSVYSSAGTVSGSYGYIFPELGTIILNPNALAADVVDGGLGETWDYSTPGPSTTPNSINNRKLFQLVSGSGTNTGFSLQASETISSNYIFCRVRNFQDNYTSNPTIIDSSGNLIYNQLVYSPVTYITTVGLYNDNNELLAVAKLSKPLQKDFTKEALIRVKMDF
jgi:hypothetical protein